MTVRIDLTAANDNPGGACRTTVAITGLVALLARSQARRFAEQTTPANANTAPATRRLNS